MVAILCDIDHTLSDAFHRDRMITPPHTDWDAYHAASVHDGPIPEIINFINLLQATHPYSIVGITARPAKWRALTMGWLAKQVVAMDEILMRADQDFRPAPEIKLALARQRFSDIRNEVAFILDDRDDVCAAFRAIGVTALQVHARRL